MNKIWIVDAFAYAPFTGNPAAVMIAAEFPENMQLIAAEMNLSETVFVKPLTCDHFHIRWFTPQIEVALCGHATMAAAHIIFQEGLHHTQQIVFDSLSGYLQVSKNLDEIVLNFPLQPISQQLDKTYFEAMLNVSENSIEEVVQAHDDVIIVLKNEWAVRNFTPDFTKIKAIEARGVIITASSVEYDFVSRFFGPRVGVNEDPVTGSAHCKLADYWAKRLLKNHLRAYQASQRGGILHLEVTHDRVLIKGKAITIMQGQWLV